jgi:tRNA threonylcarbamoyladenosine biosynthesis protein TsaE
MPVFEIGMDDLIAKTLDDLPAIARALFQKYKEERVFALRGMMGAGKTTFMHAIAKELKSRDIVSSPTFAIVNEYRCLNGEAIYHFDFYRINNLKEVVDIGFEEYLYSGNYCFIEWAENIEELLPEKTINVYITTNANLSRTFSF